MRSRLLKLEYSADGFRVLLEASIRYVMSLIAPVLDRTTNQICFCIDDVTPCDRRLPTQRAKRIFEERFNKSVLVFSHSQFFEVVQETGQNALAKAGIHPLALAIHLAFSDHRPLRLTPDAIWLTLAQGVAHHVNNHAETLRPFFVKHSGKEKLQVEFQALNQPEEWANLIQEFALHIRDRVGAEFYQLMECNFSTTTPVTRTASHVTMMDTFQQYFEYEMSGICGIPSLTLLGTVEDWQAIRDRVSALAQYNLSWWTDKLIPICDQFVETAAGKPSLSFWQSIYKPKRAYGSNVITGWLACLFPYLTEDSSQLAPTLCNPFLSIAAEDITINDGISLARLPTGLACAPVEVKFRQQSRSLELLAGFIGISQESKSRILEPKIGWAVCPKT